MSSNPLVIYRNTEAVTSDSLNRALQAAHNSQSFGRSGAVLSIGSVSVNGNQVTINNIKVALPNVVLQNSDLTAQILNGIETDIGSITRTISPGNTELFDVSFSVTNNTGNMFTDSTRIYSGNNQSNDYQFYVRTNEFHSVAFDPQGGVSLGIFEIKNVGGSDYELFVYSSNTSVCPLFQSVPNLEAYEKLGSFYDNMLLPHKIIQNKFDALGSMSDQDKGSVDITGGDIKGSYRTDVQTISSDTVIDGSHVGSTIQVETSGDILVTMNNSSASNVQAGEFIELIWTVDNGTSTVTLQTGGAQTLLSVNNDKKINGVGASVLLRYLGNNKWLARGDLAP
jgi:hypothetical protein